MNGQLWQECTRRGCDTEPVCVDCERCEQHCTCPSPEKKAAAYLAAERQAEAVRAARAALVARVQGEEFDPCAVPLERQDCRAVWEWVTNPAHIGSILDRVLQIETWYAPRVKRAPMTTRCELVRHLATTGKEMADGQEWYNRIRVRPEETR